MGNITAMRKLLYDKAKGIRDEYGIPNIAAVIVRDNGQTTLHTAQGVRDTTKSATASSNEVKKSDYFNVGSISKPITGFLIACLIKKGVLHWETKIADVFPEFRAQAFRDRCGMNENFLDTKVYELMAHVSGMNGDYYYALNNSKQKQRDTDPFRFIADQGIAVGGNARDKEWKNLEVVVYLRYLYAVLCLKKAKFKYGGSKNLGYENKAQSGYGSTCTICVAMVERLTGKPFETTMSELLLSPLQLQIKYGNLPSGMQLHSYDMQQGKYRPEPTMNNDFAPYASKFVTGGIHATVEGMAQFIRYNLRALNHSAIFDVAEYQEPVTNAAKGGLYLGNGANDEPLNHNGATGASLAKLRIYPHSGYGLCVMQNCNGGPEATGLNNAERAQNKMMTEIAKIHRDWDSL